MSSPPEESVDNKYPADSYSFLALHGLRENPYFFGFGFMPFFFQCFLSLLMILSVVWTDLRSVDINQEADNPGNPYKGGTEFMSTTFPANVGWLPRITQIVSIVSYMIFADGTLLDITKAIELFPCKGYSDPQIQKLFVSCLLRLTQGALAFSAAFLLVFTESSVIDIVLNFTAVNFISGLDETAFELAKAGKFGNRLKDEAKRIEKKDLPSSVPVGAFPLRYAVSVGVTSFLTVVGIVVIISFQYSSKKWVTDIFRVQFGPDSGLEAYSGCFSLNKDVRKARRFTYNSNKNKNQLPAKLGYCQQRRQWVFYKVNDDESDDPCSNRFNMLAHSRRSGSYDISTSIREEWFSFYNTPMDMYFVDKNETELNQTCGSFVNDGICDPDFNNFYYQFDGGDCCASTCSGEDCGRRPVDLGEGNETINKYVHFPHCEDKDMVDLNMTVSSKKVDGGDFTWWANQVRSQGWDELWRPSLHVECDTHTILAIGNLECLEGDVFQQTEESETNDKLVRDCIKNNTTFDQYKEVNNGLIGTKVDGQARTCRIITKHSDLVSVNITLTSKPEGLEIQHIRKPIPTEVTWLSTKLAYANMPKVIDLSGNGFIGTISNEIKFHKELRGLKFDNNQITSTIPVTLMSNLQRLEALSIANNELTGTFPWDIFIEPQSLKTLSFDNNNMTGTLPEEIGVFRSLKHLSLCNNNFRSKFSTGALPEEVGQLTSLTYLSLCGNQFTGSIPTVLEKLTNLKHLDFARNKLKGDIPSAIIQALSNLEYLNFEKNGGFTAQFPKAIESLINLKELRIDAAPNAYFFDLRNDLSKLRNMTHLRLANVWSGSQSFPKWIARNMTNLTHLDLSGNTITGTFPTEICDSLSKLTYLDLSGTQLNGILPAAIGNLTNLEHLDLARIGLTGPIPKELGELKKLTTLELHNNKFTGTIPCELESLSNLSVLNLASNDLTGEIPNNLNAEFLNVGTQNNGIEIGPRKECDIDDA